MKRLLTIIAACLLLTGMAGCNTTRVDSMYESYYTYKNNSSSDITIDIYLTEFPSKTERHTIVKGEELTLFFGGFGGFVTYPLTPSISTIRDVYCVISNGSVTVTEYSESRSGLYDNSTYTLVKEDMGKKGGSTRWYEYTFTDAFFDGGVPIEQ